MRKRFYIFFVARDEAGQLRKISIPVQYLYVVLAGAAIGALCLTGIASPYTRMLQKVAHYNQLRTEQDQLKDRYSRLEQVAKERDIQVASLGSLASEVSALYGLKSDPAMVAASSTEQIQEAQVHSSLDQLYALKHTALSGAASVGISLGLTKNSTTADWVRANSAPNLWPVEGQITGSFGERIDPFNGEGAFHSGVDISAGVGSPVIAPADGAVTFADFLAATDAPSWLTMDMASPPATAIFRASPSPPDNTSIAATPSATSASADALPGRTSTTKSASTTPR